MGGGNFTLTVNGANFTSGSVVMWNGSVRQTTYVTSNQLTAAVSAADIATEGTSLVTVANPAPNAATSAGQPFVVRSSTPVATILGASISDAADGSGNHELVLTGTDFVPGSTVEWNNASLVTTYVSPWAVSAVVPASDYALLPSKVTITAENPSPSGPSAGFELQ
jgi:hypothetical protein